MDSTKTKTAVTNTNITMSEPQTSILEQGIVHFACQSLFNTVGQKDGFKTEADYHRYAVQCGFTGLSMPIDEKGYDLSQAVKGPDYFERRTAELLGYGYARVPDRVEAHVITQNVSSSWTRGLRFGHFLGGNYATARVKEIQQRAVQVTKQLIDAASRDGIKHIICFFGGKGYAVGQSKWSAWPQHFGLWVLASLAERWNGLCEYAADKGVVLYHEAFHPENDILTGDNWVTFYKMLTPQARTGCGVLLDISHLLNVGVNPLPHVEKILSTGCQIQVHCKGGVVLERNDGTTTPLGGWLEWSKASHTFVTVGTVEPEAVLRKFYSLVAARHQTQPGGVHLYYEPECILLPMKQGMLIGAQNVKALRDNTGLIRINNVPTVEVSDPKEVVGVPQIVMPNGTTQEIEPILVQFDQCFMPTLMPWTLLGLADEERQRVRHVLRNAGHEAAANLRAA